MGGMGRNVKRPDVGHPRLEPTLCCRACNRDPRCPAFAKATGGIWVRETTPAGRPAGVVARRLALVNYRAAERRR